MRGVCHKAKGNRIVELNHRLTGHKAKVRERLNSEPGIALRKKRAWDVEPVFKKETASKFTFETASSFTFPLSYL